MAGPRARESQGRVVLPVVTGFEKLTYTGNWAGLHSSRAGKAGISSNRSSDQLAGDQRWIEVVHRDQHLQILEGNQVKIPPLTPRTANRRGKGSALARRGRRVVGTDTRRLSFVRQIPSNGEEHEKNSDDDPNIDAEY